MPNNKRWSSLFILHPSSFILPRWGRYHVLVAAALLAIGIYRGINLLMLLGYALLAMMVLNLIAAGRNVRGLRARRRIAEWVFARTPCDVEVEVSNPTRRARLGLRIEDRGPAHTLTWYTDRLPGYGRQTFRRGVVLPRRGSYTWGAVTAVSGYPFGLVERRGSLAAGQDVIVLPSVGWLHRGRFLRHLRNLTAEPQNAHVRNRPHAHPAAQAEFHGLRAYRSGDSPRLIHWRTSARRGELMVREFEDEPSDNLLLVFDPTLPAGLDGGGTLREQFEEMVSLVATVCWEWCRRRGDRLVLATLAPDPVVLEGLTGPVHARRVLECLAGLPARTVLAGPALAACLKERALPRAIAVLVAIGHSPLADTLPAALGRPVNCLDASRTDRFDFYTPPH